MDIVRKIGIVFVAVVLLAVSVAAIECENVFSVRSTVDTCEQGTEACKVNIWSNGARGQGHVFLESFDIKSSYKFEQMSSDVDGWKTYKVTGTMWKRQDNGKILKTHVDEIIVRGCLSGDNMWLGGMKFQVKNLKR